MLDLSEFHVGVYGATAELAWIGVHHTPCEDGPDAWVYRGDIHPGSNGETLARLVAIANTHVCSPVEGEDVPETPSSDPWIWEYCSPLVNDVIYTADEHESEAAVRTAVAASFTDFKLKEITRRGVSGIAILVNRDGAYRDTGHWFYRKPAPAFSGDELEAMARRTRGEWELYRAMAEATDSRAARMGLFMTSAILGELARLRETGGVVR